MMWDSQEEYVLRRLELEGIEWRISAARQDPFIFMVKLYKRPINSSRDWACDGKELNPFVLYAAEPCYIDGNIEEAMQWVTMIINNYTLDNTHVEEWVDKLRLAASQLEI